MFHEILKIRVKHLFNLQFKTRLIFRKCMLLIGKKGPRASLILQVFYYEDTGLPAKLETSENLTLNRQGEGRLAPPSPDFVCPSTLIFDTITVISFSF